MEMVGLDPDPSIIARTPISSNRLGRTINIAKDKKETPIEVSMICCHHYSKPALHANQETFVKFK